MPADVFVDTNVLVYPGAESLSGLITLQQPPTLAGTGDRLLFRLTDSAARKESINPC
jgi:hypothetical protein